MHLLRCYVTSSLGQVVEKEQELCLPQKKKKNYSSLKLYIYSVFAI